MHTYTQVALHAINPDQPSTSSTMITTLQGHTTPVTCLALTGDGVHLLAGAQDGSARMYQLASRQVVRMFEGPVRGPLTGVLVTDKLAAMVPGM